MQTVWEKAFEAFRRMIPAPVEDGCGGYGRRFAEGEAFRGAAVPLGGGELDGGPVSLPGGRVRIAAERSAPLRYGDTVMRLSDGALFRITGEVSRPPECAGIGFQSADAERIGGEDGVFGDGWPSPAGGSGEVEGAEAGA